MKPPTFSRREFVIASAALPLAAKHAAGASASPSQLSAFVSGVNDYSTLESLERSVNDATSVAAGLQEMGYAATLSINESLSQFQSSLDKFLSQIRHDTTVVLYLSGHGVQINNSNFLLASDFEYLAAENELKGAAALDEILNAVAEMQPENCLCIVDACRNNPLQSYPVECSGGLASVQAPRGFYVAYAAGSGQTAMDRIDRNDPSDNGLYARHLIPNLSASLSVDEVIKRTRVDVARVAASVGHAQNPAIYDQSEPFTLVGQALTARRSAILVDEFSRIADCVALVVGVQQFRSRDMSGKYPGAINDANNFAMSLNEHGVELLNDNVLLDPSDEELLAACKSLAKSGKRTIFYYAGPGFFYSGDGYLMVGPKANGGDLSVAFSIGIIASLLSQSGQSCLMAIDSGLPEFPNAASQLEFSQLLPLTPKITDLHSQQGALGSCYDNLSILYSSNFFQTAVDIQDGAMNSPFEIALANAINRPLLNMESLAELVRSEVEDMTSGMQTPVLMASQIARKHVWVTDDPIASAICSPLR